MFDHLPDAVSVYEVSLRDGLQNEKATVRLRDKLRLRGNRRQPLIGAGSTSRRRH